MAVPTIKQIRHFLAIFDYGSLQNAAKSVCVSQPALTRSLVNFENELGVKLFERSKSGMTPTSFALSTVQRYRDILMELEDIQREAVLYKNLDTGHLNLGFGKAVRELLVRNCLPAFVERYPNISITVKEGDSKELAGYLRDREIDILFAGYGSYEEYSFIRAEQIVNLPIRIYVRKKHPLTQHESVSFSQLIAYPQVVPTTLSLKHKFRLKMNPIFSKLMQPHFICSDYRLLESIVRSSKAWSVTLDNDFDVGKDSDFAIVNIKDSMPQVELSVLELNNRSRSPSIENMIQLVKTWGYTRLT